MQATKDYNALLDKSIHAFLMDASKIVYKNPVMASFVLQTIVSQNKAAQKRKRYQKQNIQVPPYMIISVTNRCNLHCAGCYSRAQHRPVEKELSPDKLHSILSEAKDLGISFMFLAGGEPLMRPEILNITRNFPEVIFPLFTNGLLITDEIIEKLRKQKNVIPVISIEGYELDTDGRRGAGVYHNAEQVISQLSSAGIFFGLSFTVTRKNFETLTDINFIDNLISSGCQLFIFVEYIPVNNVTENLVITDEQRASLTQHLDSFRTKAPGLFVSFPGDEEMFGGCLSAGRGFINISAEGALEPCPFAPYSDANLNDMPLKEALKSDLLKQIRQNHEGLLETSGGCALWNKREWVRSLLQVEQLAVEPDHKF